MMNNFLPRLSQKMRGFAEENPHKYAGLVTASFVVPFIFMYILVSSLTGGAMIVEVGSDDVVVGMPSHPDGLAEITTEKVTTGEEVSYTATVRMVSLSDAEKAVVLVNGKQHGVLKSESSNMRISGLSKGDTLLLIAVNGVEKDPFQTHTIRGDTQ